MMGRSRNRKRLKGNSLVEVLIALAILSFASMLTVIVFLNVQKSNKSFFRLKAMEACELYLSQTLEKKEYTEGQMNSEEFSLKRTMERHQQFPDCQIIRIIAFDGNKKKLTELESLVKF